EMGLTGSHAPLPLNAFPATDSGGSVKLSSSWEQTGGGENNWITRLLPQTYGPDEHVHRLLKESVKKQQHTSHHQQLRIHTPLNLSVSRSWKGNVKLIKRLYFLLRVIVICGMVW
ncbi:hypothetical protein PMAYCL1PPCAC_09977, partial [Pristionchus mayeri]